MHARMWLDCLGTLADVWSCSLEGQDPGDRSL
jgi:hypothetical protein